MVQTQERRKEPAERIHSGVLKLEFGAEDAFGKELRRRVDELFRSTGRRKRGGRPMVLKTVIILTWFVASYMLLVFAAQGLWQGLGLAVLLGLATAAIGMNIQHDAGHGAYSEHAWVNRVMAMTMDLVGGSSYTWRWKHTVIHHRYVNITGYDTDIDIGRLGRYTPEQGRLWYHRWQHLYLWVFYAFYGMKVQLVDSWRFALLGRISRHRIPRPKGAELVLFLTGKAIFFAWAFAIPMLLHPVWVVLFYYVVAALMLGVVMVLVFIVPHLNAVADFPVPRADTGRMGNPWMVHQAQVAVDFARHNRVLTWLVGGLNYHKEHHLFPAICHANYPSLALIVEQTCRDFGIPYKEHKSFAAGIAAHYRWLRRMGAAN
jgi:linoleoyl-CoA desaturase